MANPSGSEVAASCKAHKRTCLCSPTNHPGSFRCSRHRTPRARPLLSSSLVRASQQQAAAPGATVIKTGGGRGRPVLRAHLQRLLSGPPPSTGGRCREFRPRLSRLGRLAVNS
uniref:Uncharacterized protein n=1 Tax=Avena sativa TaxID=4498 RepID=A0ACD5ZFG9_AVESA